MPVKLSVIIVCYNMARELPRTVLSLSPRMQQNIAADDYEIIVVDNGSTEPFDERRLLEDFPGLSVHRLQDPTPSPVAAVNKGLQLSQGDLVGVFIDGARLASPGLLAGALRAAQLHHSPVIGTLAFHLGPDLQSRSVGAGYDQRVEDELLHSSEWERDGYRLFDIAVLAGSSSFGWFVVPAETNALFLTRRQWKELRGYDTRFVTPGGGLANLDMWHRACVSPDAFVILLLGEATFHQVHGGVSTNASAANGPALWQTYHDEYVRIRGHAYEPPRVTPHFFGRLNLNTIDSMKSSLDQLRTASG